MTLRMRSRFDAACFVFALLTATVVLAPSTHAQSQEQELQQMKDKVQQLEQQLEELKAQLNQVTQAQQKPATSAPTATAVTRADEEAQETAAAPEAASGKNTVDIYGHVMLDSGYEFGQSDPNWFVSHGR